eukprot:4929600-Pyramimonas_sp.AAC.1
MSCHLRSCLFGAVVNECQRLQSVSAPGSVVISKAFVDRHFVDSLKGPKLWVHVDRPVYDTSLKGVDTITYYQALVAREDPDVRVTCVRDFLELNLRGNWYTNGIIVCVDAHEYEDTLVDHVRDFRQYEARYRTKFQPILVDPA